MSIIQNVAIVGPTGNLGKAFTEALVATGKHNVTALTRADSSSVPPSGTKVAKVNFDDEASLVTALTGVEFLVITLNTRAPPTWHKNLVSAAAKAGVQYVMPNAYGYDLDNKKFGEEYLYGPSSIAHCEDIAAHGMKWIALSCGFWYSFSVGGGEHCFGFDFQKESVTLFDDGNVKMSVSTWEQCGRALASLLSLPASEVAEWGNKCLMISSFRVSQRDMLDAVQRVTGKQWSVRSEPSLQRYQGAMAQLARGERIGFVKAMYTRAFFPSGDADFEGPFSAAKGTANARLGLPVEDLDEATREGVQIGIKAEAY